MLQYLVGWKGYAAASILSAILAGYLVSLPYRLTISNMQRDIATADARVANDALVQFIDQTNRIKGAADEYAGLLNTFNGRMGKISNDLRKAMEARPLPVDCKPDAGRMQSLSAAVAATNAAAGRDPVPAMPVTP